MNNWKEERNTQYREQQPKGDVPLERNLPHPRFVQDEMESIVSQIDEREAEIRRKQALAQRWFGYYKACKDKKKRSFIIDQYNRIALMKGRE